MSGETRPPAPVTVLFLCTGNAARSILAEALLNRVGAPAFRAFSAGSSPKGAVNDEALAMLHRLEIETAGLRSKSWDEFTRPDAPRLDVAVTLCDSLAGEVCPTWPGAPLQTHWSVPDPTVRPQSGSSIEAGFSAVLTLLQTRIEALRALPFGDVDRAAMQRRLDAIGRDRSTPLQ